MKNLMKNKNIDKDPILYMSLHCETDSCCVIDILLYIWKYKIDG